MVNMSTGYTSSSGTQKYCFQWQFNSLSALSSNKLSVNMMYIAGTFAFVNTQMHVILAINLSRMHTGLARQCQFYLPNIAQWQFPSSFFLVVFSADLSPQSSSPQIIFPTRSSSYRFFYTLFFSLQDVLAPKYSPPFFSI